MTYPANSSSASPAGLVATSAAGVQYDIAPSAQDSVSWATYYAGIRIVALRKLGDLDLAEDIAQEAIARAMDALARRPREIADLGAFIYGIARHVIGDTIRSRSHAIPPALENSIEDPRTDALTGIVIEEERAHLRQALKKLSDTDSRLLHLIYVQGLTSVEIAKNLGQSPARVRKRKERAVERLRSAFSMNASHSAS